MANAKTMARELLKRDYTLVSGGTDNHLVLANLKASKGVDGARVESLCNKVKVKSISFIIRNIYWTLELAFSK